MRGKVFTRYFMAVAAMALAFAVTAGAAPALARVTVVLTDDVTKAIRKSGENPRGEQRRLEDDFNTGLEALGATYPEAQALFDSGQTIRIICAKSPEAKRLGIKLGGAPAESHGDFDEDGKPKRGGTTTIVIDCEKIALLGMDKPFFDIDPRSTANKVLMHELYHAGDAARRHPPDDLDIYNAFVDAFVAALEAAREDKRKEQRTGQRTDRRQSSVPNIPGAPAPEGTPGSNLLFAETFPGGVKVSLDYAAAFNSPSYELETNFGNFAGGGSDTLSSIGIDVRGNFGQISDDIPIRVFAGAWARVNLGGDEQNELRLDLHPTPGLDSSAYFTSNGFAMPYVGVGAEIENFADTGTDIYWSFYAGLRVESRTLTLVTDETGGAGQVNRFEKSQTEANLTLGWDLDFECETQPLFFRVGGAVDFKSPLGLDERSTLGNRYELGIDGTAEYRLILGAGLRF
jgi:hypothetical protein